MKNRNQLQIISTNSFWNTTNFIFAGLFGIVFSIIITRYLGPKEYGRYSYLLSIISILMIVFEFGTSQAISKYVPKYYNDDKNKSLAVKLFKKIIIFQFLITLFFSFILFLTKAIWINKFDLIYFPNFLLISLCFYIPFSIIINSLISFISATQNYKIITLAKLCNYFLTLILIIIGINLGKNSSYYIAITLLTNIIFGIYLYLLSKKLFTYENRSEKKFDIKEAINFTSFAYINLLVQFVVWSYSEIFFLKKYSTLENLGFYTLAFTIATLYSSILGTSQKSAFNAQFELLEQKEDLKADQMTYLMIKYAAIIFLPLSIITCFLIKYLINFVYGENYLAVATVLPYIIFAAIFGTIFTPIAIKTNNNNKIFKKIVFIVFMGAILNIILDYILIPKYNLIGAGIANCTSQITTNLITTLYIFKHLTFNFKLNKIIKIFLLNLGLGILTFTIYKLNLNTWQAIIYCISIIILYIKSLKLLQIFEKIDFDFINIISTSTPISYQFIFKNINKFYRKI